MVDLPYPALLTLHLLAVVAFLGGLFVSAASLPGLASGTAAEVGRARQINRWLTTPALVLVWVLGLSLASAGGWFGAGWLHAKIALVLLLSALHGVLSARLRRLHTPDARPTGYRPLVALAALVTAIVALVAFKPG